MKPLKGLRLLVVDDDDDLREMMADEFGYAGAEVFKAAGGNEALEMLATVDIQAVVTDLKMPNGDGMSILRGVQTLKNPPRALVVVTGFSDISNDEFTKNGATAIFPKPFDFAEVILSLRKTLQF